MKKQKKAAQSTTSSTAGGNASSKSTDKTQGTGSTAQDAESLLKADHRKVEGLFQKFEQASSTDEKEELAHQICTELMVHTDLEEKIFYPACRDGGVESEVLNEAQVEHDGAKVLINELLNQSAEWEFYDAKVKVLSEYIKHHVREEEKGDGIFAKAKEAGIDMDALGQRLQARKTDVMAKAEAQRLDPPIAKSLFSRLNQQHRIQQEELGMNRQMSGRHRDEYGRFTSDDDDYGNGRSRQSRSRYEDDEDHRRGRQSMSGRHRDEQGRFMSDDDDYRGGERYSQSRSRYEDDDDDRRSSRSRSQGGWFGDPQGHAEASRRGWEQRQSGDTDYRGSSRSRYEDDDRERGYSSRSRSSGRYEDDDRRSMRGGHQGERGWFGDPQGHSEASRLGWEHRQSRSRYEDDDDDRRSRSSSRGRGSSRSQGHGGWFGDSEGHSEAARRGWENR
jgi:hypothetical protein